MDETVRLELRNAVPNGFLSFKGESHKLGNFVSKMCLSTFIFLEALENDWMFNL
jgi:hypothetical protein